MTSRYRVEYALKSHRRDEFIEWIKGLLAGPFVLHADIENFEVNRHRFDSVEDYESYCESQELEIAKECQMRYLDVFADVEMLIERSRISERSHQQNLVARLLKIVPSVGKFFTSLPLRQAFLHEDEKRQISKRRYVSPSFNDVRHVLNTAQIMALIDLYKDDSDSQLKLITFDGDVTLYNDGESLTRDSPIVQRLVNLLRMGFYIGVVTAAGYPDQDGASKYCERLKGLMDILEVTESLTPKQKENFLVMGGESNYLYRYDAQSNQLKFVDGKEWFLPMMLNWKQEDIEYIMDETHEHLLNLQRKLKLAHDTVIIKKERSVGIIPKPGYSILREQLEEMVISLSQRLVDLQTVISKNSQYGDDIKLCAFNGGSDVWVDIGDKSLGVQSLQRYLGKEHSHGSRHIRKDETLHIGDQFASLGANDFKARLSACTVWIASPQETLSILDYLIGSLET